MKTWIAFFRGINVGGNNILPMAELRSRLESLKLQRVRTYIQSGNVVFESRSKSASSLSMKIGDLVEKEFGFRPHLFLLQKEELRSAIESNPFPEAVSTPNKLHLFFLDRPAKRPKLDEMTEIASETEQFKMTDQVFYLFAQDGIGRSKLASKAEKLLGVSTTARNYRTVVKLFAMAEDSQ